MGVSSTRTWGAENFGGGSGGTLETIVRQLNPAAKQAMYGAANKGLIRRGTWNGCAFNAGGAEIGNKNVDSYFAAAKAFDLDQRIVRKFIAIWDGLHGTDESCTERLKAAILDAGLFTEPGETKGRRVLRQTIYRSQETMLREKFEEQVSMLDLDDAEDELAVSIKGVGELLSATC